MVDAFYYIADAVSYTESLYDLRRIAVAPPVALSDAPT
jgi:hypothetical protein